MGKQESVSDWFQMAKYYAKAEKELKIKRWVYISIEYKEDGKIEPVRLFSYNLPREVYERRRWVVRLRLAQLQCQHPKHYVKCFYSYYDRRSGELLGFGCCLSKLIAAKAQVTKAEKVMRDYIERSRQNNIFFDENTDEELIKFRNKLERKKIVCEECEKRLELLVEKRRNNQ